MEDQVVVFTEELAQLVLQIGIIIFAAWFGGRIFRRFHLSSVLGEIMAGIVVGPYALGQIALPGFPGGIFSLQEGFAVSLPLYSIATIASIILLFFVGLETDIDTFLRFSLAGTVVGLAGVVVSFVAGVFAAVLMAEFFWHAPLSFFHPVALFMGVMSTATSVGISARILSQHRKMDSPEGVTILSAAVIDDVLGIIVLAIVIGMASTTGIGWLEVSMISFKAIGVWLGFTFLGLVFSKQIGKFLKMARDRNTIAIFSLSLAFILAAIFEKSGLAMIIGAYVMGISLSRTDLSFMIQEKLDVMVKFFVPIFFCVMGMLVNLQALASREIILVGLVYFLFAVIGKLVGCAIPALFLNFNVRGALRIGVGMIPRGEVALIIAGIGLARGIINDEVFSVAVIMTFLTTMITPPLLDRLLRSKKSVLRKREPASEQHKTITYEMPNSETAELLLNKVLSMFDGEGFYIYHADMPERTYHIRKDTTFIVLKYVDGNLNFYCLERDAAFIHTLFYEVIAEIRNIVNNVQSYSNGVQVGKDIFHSAEPLNSNIHVKSGNVGKTISPLAVEVDLSADSKEGVIKEMIGLLVRSGQIPFHQIDSILTEIMTREKTMSTGMQDSVALPHTKSQQINQLMIAVGINKNGVDFDSLDKQPSRIFILALAPVDRNESYLQLIADISRFLSIEANRSRFLDCRNNTELFQIIYNI